jgi:ParB/RepB/Spo0J family partition protein
MDPKLGGRQIEPIVVHVQQDTGRYTLGIGSRRLMAARELEWETIAADVRTEPFSDEENLIENVRRADLTVYEQARACFHFREKKMTPAQIAAIVGVAESTVRNYMIMVRDLPKPILDDWEQDGPAVNVEFLRTIASKKNYPNPDDQIIAWEARKAAVAKVEETQEGTASTRPRHTRPGKDGLPCPVCGRNTEKEIVAAFVVTKKPAAKVTPKPAPKKPAKKGKGRK